MSRTPRIALTALLLVSAGAAPARPRGASSPAPAPAPAASPTPDPLEEFVPHDRVEADSVVAMPVDL
jgi:hypothetical protein